MSDKDKAKLKKFLVMDRGAVAGSGDNGRLIVGEAYEIGAAVSEEAAAMMIRLGKAHDATTRPRKQRQEKSAGDEHGEEAGPAD